MSKQVSSPGSSRFYVDYIWKASELELKPKLQYITSVNIKTIICPEAKIAYHSRKKFKYVRNIMVPRNQEPS
jgi:hypothetical protein